MAARINAPHKPCANCGVARREISSYCRECDTELRRLSRQRTGKLPCAKCQSAVRKRGQSLCFDCSALSTRESRVRCANRPCSRCGVRARLWNSNGVCGPCALLGGAKVRAKKKAIPFGLDVEWANSQDWTTCAATGISLKFTAEGGGCEGGPHPLTPSLSRVDHRLGYQPGNVLVTCWLYNVMLGRSNDPEWHAAVAETLQRGADLLS